MSKLAVKYRPRNFDEVVGQEINSIILKKQIEEEDISSGYLFSGGSGVGKTTVARILANKLDAEIIEIDGASNNSVDNIRKIRENTRLKSLSNKYKVYIIDETHMLSKGAFNALLKTLEEPPQNVIFILATTEPEKVPATIHTRLQNFEFTRVSWKNIKQRLQFIAEQENEDMEDDVLNYVAKLADGSVRSGISILEKVIKFENAKVEDVTQIVGDVQYVYIFRLFKALFDDRDAKAVLKMIEELHESGKDLKKVIEQVARFTVELTKYALFGNFKYIKIPTIYKEQLDECVVIVSNSNYRLRELFNTFNELSNSLKYEADEKLLVQGQLLQMIETGD